MSDIAASEKKLSTPRDRNFRDFQKFSEDLKNESDRAAVILAASKCDILLQAILQKHLIQTGTSTDSLLDQERPLSTFSSKIDLAFRLGLIDARFTKALHLIRKIRNSFAHELSGSVIDGPHADRVKDLIGLFKDQSAINHVLTAYFESKSGSSEMFRAVAAILTVRLNVLFDGVSEITPSQMYLLENPPQK